MISSLEKYRRYLIFLFQVVYEYNMYDFIQESFGKRDSLGRLEILKPEVTFVCFKDIFIFFVEHLSSLSLSVSSNPHQGHLLTLAQHGNVVEGVD